MQEAVGQVTSNDRNAKLKKVLTMIGKFLLFGGWALVVGLGLTLYVVFH